MKVKPFTPKEAKSAKISYLPDHVIDVFNEHIAKNLINGESVIYQKDLVNDLGPDAISNGWLDVEDVYRKYGWLVEYDKPGYSETYDAFFTFTAKK